MIVLCVFFGGKSEKFFMKVIYWLLKILSNNSIVSVIIDLQSIFFLLFVNESIIFLKCCDDCN